MSLAKRTKELHKAGDYLGVFNLNTGLANKVASSYKIKGSMRGYSFEDLAQEAYRVVWEEIIPTYDPEKGYFSTYCMRSLGNHFQNLFFKKVVVLDDPDDLYESSNIVSSSFMTKLRAAQIVEKFHILKPIERECLMGMCQDISDAEMGRRLGYTYQNISYHKKNAIKKLQEELS